MKASSRNDTLKASEEKNGSGFEVEIPKVFLVMIIVVGQYGVNSHSLRPGALATRLVMKKEKCVVGK